MDLKDRRIVLGITGGVAAYKACDLARRLQDQGAAVQAVLTDAGSKFVGPALLHALTGQPAYTDLWDPRFEAGMGHIHLTRGADALLVAPATADFIAKLAHGICDDLLSTLALARPRDRCALMVAPAMNVEMWSHPATQRNLRRLVDDGALVLGPAEGAQACGETGPGRLMEPDGIVEDVVAAFAPKTLAGRRVLVTAGPTFEPLDPVRGITNLSSGKMGYAIARAAIEAGAQVTLVSGPTALDAPRHARRIDVLTAQQMLDAVMAEAGGADVFVSVAAVADWRAAEPSASKLKKDSQGTPPALQLVRNPDILQQVAQLPSPPYCVGFAAETDRIVEHARVKLASKRVAMIVANRAQDVLGADRAELVIVEPDGETPLPGAAKLQQARRLVAHIGTRLPGQAAR